MKKLNKMIKSLRIIILLFLMLGFQRSMAQDSSAVSTDTTEPAPVKTHGAIVKNTFEGDYLLQDQTVNVSKPGTFTTVIQHIFGTVQNGYSDMFGLYNISNIRLGFNYVVRKNLQVGFGLCGNNLQWDGNLKWAILRQRVSNGSPVSVTYYGNFAVDTRKSSNFVNFSDRFSYFDQLMIARKINDKLSLQVSPSLSYFNNVPGYLNSNGDVISEMKNSNFSIAFAGRYKITEKTAIIVNYDQPLTQNPTNNPHPNLSLGIEMATSGHQFQIFMGNYNYIIPQDNNVFNQNDYTQGQFEIGFNISRLWNF
jgi:hypothetical protein